MDRKTILLSTIELALQLQSPPGPLASDHVNNLGQLGLSDQDTFELVRQLSANGEIELEWGGKIKSAHRHHSSSSIYLGPNATYVGAGAQIHHSAVGAHAQVQLPQTSQIIKAEILASLTAALDKLSGETAKISADQQQNYQQLTELTRTMQQQLVKEEKPDKNQLSQKLDEADKALSVLEKAEKLGTSVAPHVPRLWELLHHAYSTLSIYLGGS